MNKTTNYQLNQWERSDRVLMEDFNADNAKLDAAIKAQADALATEKAAREASVKRIDSALLKIAVGSYTGDGKASRTISVGFTPKAVYVTTVDGYTYTFSNGFGSSAPYGGLAVTGSPAGLAACPAVEIVSGGFKVAYQTETGATRSNQANQNYHYIAFG